MAEGSTRPTSSSQSSTNTSPSLSAASSSTSPTTLPPKKRTRASKPKVRTGCITWIRRVKCGEEKPACLRCTSTGRTCDGYDKRAVGRYSSPDPAQTAERAKVEFVKACQWSEALRSMRHIAADIDGTETEKRFFARFRTATVDGLAAQLCNFTAFWNRVAPSSSYQDDAVKHAVVALGAAYTLFQFPSQPVLDGYNREDLELFTVEQYNKSIEKLQRHVRSSSLESIRVTLVCCLAFISLETLRANHEMAVSHLINGLRILQSLPHSEFDSLADGSVFVWPPATDTLELRDVIQLFARLEVSACLFTSGIEPVISQRAYSSRFYDDGSSEVPFADVSHARRAMCSFQHDVMARTYEVAQYSSTGSADMFWADAAQQRQQSALASRSARLGMFVDDFFSASRFGMPVADKHELYCLYLDLLYFRCAQFQASQQSPLYPMRLDSLLISYPPPPPSQPDALLLSTILSLSHFLSSSPIGQRLQSYTFPETVRSLVDTGLVGPLWLVATHTSDLTSMGIAIRLMAENVNPVLVDGNSGFLQQKRVMIERIAGVVDLERREGMGRWFDVPRALTGVGSLPRLMDALLAGSDQSQGMEMLMGADEESGGVW